MRFTSKVEGINEYIYNLEVADAYNADSQILEGRNTINNPLVKNIDAQYLTTDGLIIVHCKMAFKIDSTDHVKIDGEAIKMGFGLSGEMGSFEINDLAEHASAKLEFHSLIYTPEYNAKFTIPENGAHNHVLIILSKSFYFKLFDTDFSHHKDFVKKVLTGQPSHFSKGRLPVTPIIKQTLIELLNITKNSSFPRILLEHKIKELLILQWEHYQGSNTKKSNEKVILSIEKAKEYLDNHFIKPPLLPELARLVSINEAKLKSEFKNRYGTSVYQYVIQQKMKYALLLLKSQAHTVSEISEKVGYSTTAHFSNAFLKYYGYRPGQILN